MSIVDKVKINTHYTRSINLERDSGSRAVLEAYIPTSRAIRTLERVSSAFGEKQGDSNPHRPPLPQQHAVASRTRSTSQTQTKPEQQQSEPQLKRKLSTPKSDPPLLIHQHPKSHKHLKSLPENLLNPAEAHHLRRLAQPRLNQALPTQPQAPSSLKRARTLPPRLPSAPTKPPTTPTPTLERRTSNPAPDTHPTRDNYPEAINQPLLTPRAVPRTAPHTWNETIDPYDAEGEEEPQNPRFRRRRTETSDLRHRRANGTKVKDDTATETTTQTLTPPGTMDTKYDRPTATIPPTHAQTTPETMDTNDDCPAPTRQTEQPAEPPITPEAMDTNDDSPAPPNDPAAPQKPIPTPRPKPAKWGVMSSSQRKNWTEKQYGKRRRRRSQKPNGKKSFE